MVNYCQLNNSTHYYRIIHNYSKGGNTFYHLIQCELVFYKVDVVAIDPYFSKRYHRYNVYEILEPKFDERKIMKGVPASLFSKCDGYVYKRVHEHCRGCNVGLYGQDSERRRCEKCIENNY